MYLNPTGFPPLGVLGCRAELGKPLRLLGNDSPTFIPTPKLVVVAQKFVGTARPRWRDQRCARLPTVIFLLTRARRQHTLDSMKTEQHQYAHDVDTLLTNVRSLLDSPNARDRVRAVHVLAAGVESMERRVLFEAQAAGMSWTEIGAVYGVSRQAAHRRFADETLVPSDFFDALLDELDEPPEVIPAPARAAKRACSHPATP